MFVIFVCCFLFFVVFVVVSVLVFSVCVVFFLNGDGDGGGEFVWLIEGVNFVVGYMDL